jgi:hypothetical protein
MSRILVYCVLLLIASCGHRRRDFDEKGANYLCPDSLYRTNEDREQFLQLFRYMDTIVTDSNSYTEQFFPRMNSNTAHKVILDKYIDNIFFNKYMDTVCLIVAYLTRWEGDTTRDRLFSQAIMLTYAQDSIGNYYTEPEGGLGSWLWDNGDILKDVAYSYRQYVLRWGYFKKGTFVPDPDFYRRNALGIDISQEGNPKKGFFSWFPESGPF